MTTKRSNRPQRSVRIPKTEAKEIERHFPGTLEELAGLETQLKTAFTNADRMNMTKGQSHHNEARETYNKRFQDAGTGKGPIEKTRRLPKKKDKAGRTVAEALADPKLLGQVPAQILRAQNPTGDPLKDEEAALRARLDDAEARTKKYEEEDKARREKCKREGHLWDTDWTGSAECQRCPAVGFVQVTGERTS